MTTEKALQIWKKYNTKQNLERHATAVSETLRHFAKLTGEDEEYWASVGLLHDVDYEQYPDEHCHKIPEILSKEGIDAETIRAIQSHGYIHVDGIPEPQNQMEWTLFAIDQLTGFIIACALIRPEKKLALVDMASINKRWKIPTFAGGTKRDLVLLGCEKMDKSFEYVAEQTLVALQGVADKLGL